MINLVGDFETFYGTKYSLRCMSYSDYISDQRFEIFGCSFKYENNTTFWAEGQDLRDYLYSLDWNNINFIAHNNSFDGLILTQHYGLQPQRTYCTLGAGRALFPGRKLHLDALCKLLGIDLPPKTGILTRTINKHWGDFTKEEQQSMRTYGRDDTDKAAAIFEITSKILPQSEQDIMSLMFDCAFKPELLLDRPRAKAALAIAKEEQKAIIKDSGYSKTVLGSNVMFAQVLVDHGVKLPMKLNAKDVEIWAFAKNDWAFQRLYSDYPHIRHILKGREAAKSNITVTRLQRLIDLSDRSRNNKLPVMYKYYGGHTGRGSGDNKVNFQNMTRKGEMRKCIIAPSGHVIVVADSSQIEPRNNAHLSDHERMLTVFRNKGDIYSVQASAIYGKTINRKRKELNEKGIEFYPDEAEGFVGKVCVLALGYGQGWKSFQNILAVGSMGPPVFLTDIEAQRIVTAYRADNYPITRMWKIANDQWLPAIMQKHKIEYKYLTIDRHGIWLPNGLSIQYPNLRWVDTERSDFPELVYGAGKKIYGGKVIENTIQALARIVVFDQTLELQRRGYRCCMMSHDEDASVVPEHLADEALEEMIEVMSTPPAWAPDLPVAAEGGWAREYSK